MQLFNYSFRYLLKNRGNSLARLLSLSLGLAVALLVFSYVGFNMSFNGFFPDKERVYQVWIKSPQFGISDKQVKPFAPNLVADMPQVEAAAHFIETEKLFGTTDNVMTAKSIGDKQHFFRCPWLWGNQWRCPPHSQQRGRCCRRGDDFGAACEKTFR